MIRKHIFGFGLTSVVLPVLLSCPFLVKNPLQLFHPVRPLAVQPRRSRNSLGRFLSKDQGFFPMHNCFT